MFILTATKKKSEITLTNQVFSDDSFSKGDIKNKLNIENL